MVDFQVPTLLEIVGLSYTVWFSTRYLLFKVFAHPDQGPIVRYLLISTIIIHFGLPWILQENREEFFTKIEYIKQEVFGSDDD